MIKSMTGFGRGEYSDGKRRIVAEIKTVNHRYADINIKMPRRYLFAEERIKGIVKETVKRGKAEVSIIVENITESDVCVNLNIPVAEQYIENLRTLKETYSLSGEVDLKLVSMMPDVLKAVPDSGDEEEITAAICRAVEEASHKLDEMRKIEGEKLAEDLSMRGNIVRDIVSEIDKRAPKVVVEELVRLDSHMKQLEMILRGEKGPIGKKLDFLVQEMNRETNTIGSKSNDLEITGYMLDAKSEIEKIREQVQNIE